MDINAEQLEIRRTPRAYEAYLGDEKAGSLAITTRGDVIVAIHTEVSQRAEGRGVGSTLARTLLDDARSTGRRVYARCPFVAGWIKRHPEYQDAVAASTAGG